MTQLIWKSVYIKNHFTLSKERKFNDLKRVREFKIEKFSILNFLNEEENEITKKIRKKAKKLRNYS